MTGKPFASFVVAAAVSLIAIPERAIALPPAEDTPEEVLRNEILLEARSPLDGEPLTPAEYAALQAQLQEPTQPPQLSSEIRYNIFLLQLLRMFRTLSPF
ncbi:hypothetical protein NEA10_09765 [Phormidium yuhuli AB48]|uniref:Glutathione S-transferase n=2 Tax=Phormidium TaxID=1198 RepID=A0ABY5AXW1_9CYAN|nr:hypothetical protein NEA10_09765 [Phormidium yuhuli AB48]